MSMWYDIDDVLNLFGISDSDIDAKATIEDAIYAGELSPISTKEVKYFDEDEKVWKIGSVIVANACVKDAPSIDIVRCKECKYWSGCKSTMHNNHICGRAEKQNVDYWTRADDFCSYGERKE